MIESGDIVSVHTPFEWKKPLTWISYLIRRVTKFYWNHNFIFYVIDGVPFVVESDISGVVMYPLININPKKIIRVHRLPRPFDSQKLMSRVYKTKYDFRGLLIHGLVKEYAGIWIGPTSPGEQYEKFTCCEFIEWYLGLPDAYKCNPKHLDDYCIANGRIIYEGPVKSLIE